MIHIMLRMADDRYSRYTDLDDLRASESCWLAATKRKIAPENGDLYTQPPLSFRNGGLAAGTLRCEERARLGLFAERFGGQVDVAGPKRGFRPLGRR